MEDSILTSDDTTSPDIKDDDDIGDVLDLESGTVRRVIIASCVGTVIEW
jgi:hypothetical protein